MKDSKNTTNTAPIGKSAQALQVAVLGVLALCMGFVFIYWTLVPYAHMYSYFSRVESAFKSNPSELTNPNDPIYRESPVQLSVRMSLVELLNKVYESGEMKGDSPLVPFAASNFAAEVARHPECLVNCYLDLGKAYDLLASVEPAQSAQASALAEAAYKKGLTIVPEDQALVYAYAINLTNQGRVNDGITLLKHSLAIDTTAAYQTHYYYGLLLYRADPANANQALAELEKGMSGGAAGDPATTRLIYQKMLQYYYGQGDLARFTTVVKRLSILPETDPATYKKILQYIEANNNLPPIQFNS